MNYSRHEVWIFPGKGGASYDNQKDLQEKCNHLQMQGRMLTVQTNKTAGTVETIPSLTLR
jgi:hypothetical protein